MSYANHTCDDVVRVIDKAMLEYELCENPPKFLTDNGTQMTSNKFSIGGSNENESC